MPRTRPTYTVTCPHCGTGYESRRTAASLAKLSSHACGAVACNTACAEIHNAAVAAFRAERAAAPRVARPRPTHVPATDGNYLAMLMGATKVRSR